MESSEILSIRGDPDLELEPFTPTCLDQWDHCGTPVFSFLSPGSSPSSTIVDPEPPTEQPNPQARLSNSSPPASPTTNVLINNSIPFSTVNLESEDEPLLPADISRENIRPATLRPDTLILRITPNLWLFTNNIDVNILPPGPELLKSPDLIVICPTNSNQSFLHGKSYIAMVPGKNLQLRTTLFHLNGLLYP